MYEALGCRYLVAVKQLLLGTLLEPNSEDSRYTLKQRERYIGGSNSVSGLCHPGRQSGQLVLFLRKRPLTMSNQNTHVDIERDKTSQYLKLGQIINLILESEKYIYLQPAKYTKQTTSARPPFAYLPKSQQGDPSSFPPITENQKSGNWKANSDYCF